MTNGVQLWGLVLFGLALLAASAAAAVGIYLDARRRGPAGEAAAWAIGSLLLPPGVLPLYLRRVYSGTPAGAAAGAILPWVRGLNYLVMTGWATLVHAALIGLVLVVLARTQGWWTADRPTRWGHRCVSAPSFSTSSPASRWGARWPEPWWRR